MEPIPVLIGMGGNLGDVVAAFGRARLLLSSDIVRTRLSPVFRTRPCYDKPGATAPTVSDPDYFNAVMHGYTWWPPHDLMVRLLEVEKALGRVRPAPECAPRPIDLDLLLYGEQIIRPNTDNDLEIPHPRMHLRAFVLVPACRIVPNMVHPVLGKTLREIWESRLSEGDGGQNMADDIVDIGGFGSQDETVVEDEWGDLADVIRGDEF